MKWTGTCGACQQWNTLTEEVSLEEKKPRFEAKRGEAAKPVRVRDVEMGAFKRLSTKMGELDRLFGDGVAFVNYTPRELVVAKAAALA